MSAEQQPIIVGAGLAGLTAALHLAERGLKPLLLEADPECVGGRLSGGAPISLMGNGKLWLFPGEHGIHGVWGQYHNFRALLNREGIAPGYVKARREAWILRNPGGRVQWAEGGSALRNSWIPAPFHYLALFVRPRFLQMLTLRDLASLFRVLGSLLFALAFDPAADGDQLAGLTLADFFKGWSPTLQALFTGLARNFTSERPELVPQAGFIAFLRFYTLLRRDAWAFSYFDRDSDRALIEPLLARFQAAGGTLQLGARVEQLTQTASGWRVSWPGGEACADQVILALDAPANRKLLQDSPDTQLAAGALNWPLAVPTAVLRFWFSRTPRSAAEAGIFTGDFTIDNFFWLHRFQTAFAAWHAQTGGSAIEVHVYGPPETLKEPDAVLLARALLDLQRVWPGLRGAVLEQSIRRNPPTHTLFSTTGEQIGVQTPWKKLWACGDWVRYPHPSLYMERAVVTGIAAANGVLGETEQAAWPILPADRPEPLIRGLQSALHWVRRRARSYNQRRRTQSAS